MAKAQQYEVIPKRTTLPQTTAELRQIVLEEMQLMRSGTISPSRLRATALAASTVLNSVMTDIAYQRHTGVASGDVPLLPEQQPAKNNSRAA